MDYFFFYFSEKHLQFRKKSKAFVRENGEIFGSPQASNQIFLKDMYITLKGLEKILFVLLLRIVLMYNFLNFPAVFTKKKFSLKLAYNFPCEKVNFSQYIQLILPFIDFEEHY